MQFRKSFPLIVAALALTSCASPTVAEPTPHGYVEGAAEASEPQLHLAAVGADGSLTLIDLLDEQQKTIGVMDVAADVSTNGRYVFAATNTGVTIADSGVWTVDHEDHFHYYRAEPRIIGTVAGDGVAQVASDTLATTVSFANETVVLDSEKLGEGEIVELARIASDGMAAPLGEAVVVAHDGELRSYDLDGTATGTAHACDDPAGTITTRVGVVIGCTAGAVLYTGDFELVAYPRGTAASDRAVEFDNRAGRPTVAAVAGTAGYWLLDTRERTWSRVDSPELREVAAVDDREGHVVAIAADGRLLVFDASGEQVAATDRLDATEPLNATEQLGATGVLTIDATRAYVNASGVVYEIDFADGARIAREFAIDAAFVVETGR